MKRKLLLVLAFIALPGFANALGLGKLQLNSALNQPFNARIELVAASADELNSLNVGLADIEAFRRAKIDRLYVLTKLRFEVIESETGPDYIHVSSRDAIREPFLNFLLEINWSSGRLYREYTVLLDPPLYDPYARRSAKTDSYTPSTSSSDSYVVDDTEVDEPTQSVVTPSISYSGNEYGPTDASDTLWSIASQVRPDNSVSVQQMMMAFLRSNPEAFINGNINGLKRGQILNIPTSDEIDALSLQEAIAEVRSQNSSWQGTSGVMSDAVSERADSMDMADDISSSDIDDEPSSTTMIEDDESELRLVAASSDGAGIGQGGGDSGTDTSIDLTLANEQLQAVTQENADLQDRMHEAEAIIDDLKRLIALKDDELAALQQQMAAEGVVEQPEPMDAMADEEPEMAIEPEDEFAVDEEDAAELVADEELVEEEVLEEALEVVVDDEEAEAAMDEAIEDTAIEDEEPTPVAAETVPPSGIVDQILGFVMGNLIVIAGALGGLIIVIVLLLYISRRKQSAVTEAGPVSTTEFPDFDDSEAEVDLAGSDAETASDMAVDESEDETVLPVESDEAGNKIEFVAPPDPQEEAAAAAPEPEPEEPEEPEEDPLAEVNVFLAYEHFDQAEEFVREAIAGDPDNLEFQAKLLEVFYAASDKKSYEQEAQILHDKVNGEGPHWEMAQAMWQEMSPSRALFAEGGDEPAVAAEAEGPGGIMDITAEEDEGGDSADAGVDFDLGMDAGDAAVAEAGSKEEDILDLTADGEDLSVLDVTSAIDITDFTSDEDLLDVTAAVGLETEESVEEDVVVADDAPILDITAGAEAYAAADDDVLDITAGAEASAAADDDVLDMSHSGGEDLMDVTANANLEAEGMEEDLLDVTSAGGAGADSEELLEVPAEEPAEDDNAVDFDIGGMDMEADIAAEESEGEIALEEAGDDDALDLDMGMDSEPLSDDTDTEAESVDENVIDFDTGTTDEEVSLELDTDAEDTADDGGIELELDADSDGDVELDLSIDDGAEDAGEISIEDTDNSSEESLEIDLSIDDDSDSGGAELEIDAGADDDLEIDMTLDDGSGDDEAGSGDVELDMDFDLEIQDDSADVPEIDMEGTVEMPKLDLDDMGIEIDDDDDDDDDGHTVFVPRAGTADEQSAEDEIATKLDLAKAYVELGDKDSAKGILDEVLAEGSDEQKQTAQDLLKQLD